MICPNCGKECPEKKFCIYCGSLLEDPNTIFQGIKFESVEKCNEVKNQYDQLVMQYLPYNKEPSLADLKKIREDCQHNIGEISTKLFLQHIESIENSIQANNDKKRAKLCISLLNIGYAVYFIATIFLFQIFSIGGNSSNLLNMLALVVSGKLGGAAWITNILIILGFAAVILGIIGNVMDNSITAQEVGASITLFVGLIWFMVLIFGFLGVQAKILPAYWALFIIGIVVTTISTFIKNKYGIKE